MTVGCLAASEYWNADALFSIGFLSVYGWMINPLSLIFCVKGLKAWWKERTEPECDQVIGRKWIWFILWPAITAVLWLLSGVLFVQFTGGV